MNKDIEIELNAKIADFKNVAWNDAVEELNRHFDLTDIRVLAFYDAYQAGIELMGQNKPFFRLSFFFRFFRPTKRYPYWHVRPSIAISRGNMEISGLEKRYSVVNKEISQFTGADVFHLVKSLVRDFGQGG